MFRFSDNKNANKSKNDGVLRTHDRLGTTSIIVAVWAQ